MRNLLTLGLIFVSVAAKAQETKNYEAKYINDDGSVTLYRPKFSNPTGKGSLPFSSRGEMANLNGICKLFDVGTFVVGSALYEWNNGPIVRLTQDGNFKAFDSGFGIQSVHSLICSGESKN